MRLRGGNRRPALLFACTVLLVGAVTPAMGAYRTLCARPVDGFPVIASARDAAAAEARQLARSNPSSSSALLARVKADLLRVVLQVKQADPLAFPAHAFAGAVLEAGRCSPDAVEAQWRKAAVHAWAEWSADLAAAGLARTLGASRGGEETVMVLERLVEEQPWHAANVARVLRRYRRG